MGMTTLAMSEIFIAVIQYLSPTGLPSPFRNRSLS
jgi:hypothetical protein